MESVEGDANVSGVGVSGGRGDVEREGVAVGGVGGVSALDGGSSGFYVDSEGEDEEDDGFAVTMNTQALSSMATVPTTTASARPSRTAPQAMRTFDASGHGVGGVQVGAASVGAQTTTVTAKVSASLAPLTTLGSSSSATRVSLAPNAHIGGLLTQSDEARYYAHLQASAMENYPDKPWAREGVDPSDYFNYGFTEETWTLYRERQLALRKDNGALYLAQDAHATAQSSARYSGRSGRQHAPRDTFTTATTFQQTAQAENRNYEARSGERRGREERGTSRRDNNNNEYIEASDRDSRDYNRHDDANAPRRGDNRGGRRGEPATSSRDSSERRYDDYATKKRGRSPDHRDNTRDDDNRKKPRR